MIALGLLAVIGIIALAVMGSRKGFSGLGGPGSQAPEKEVPMNSRLYAAAVLAGVAILAITLVLVFQFGRHNPSPPSLTDNPNPAIPGKLIFINERQCAMVLEASGASSQEVYCFGATEFWGSIYWVDENTFGYISQPGQTPQLTTVDILTGERGEPRPAPGVGDPWREGRIAPDGTEAVAEDGGTIVLIKDGVRTEIADFDVPRNHWPQPMLWSPDSQWIVLNYYPPRGGDNEVWIISRDGQVRGTLAEGYRGVGIAWWIDGEGGWPPLPE